MADEHFHLPSGIFSDRRKEVDRRQQSQPIAHAERRARFRRSPSTRFNANPWWLQVDYLIEKMTGGEHKDESAKSLCSANSRHLTNHQAAVENLHAMIRMGSF